MKRIETLIALLLVSVLCNSAWARTWTSSNGKYTLEAELVEVKDGKAFLKRNDGNVIGVPVDKLSEADQQFLQQQVSDTPESTKNDLPSVKTMSVEEALRKQISYEFIDTPLMNVIAFLSKQADVNFYVSRRRLEELGVGVDTPITAQGKNVALASALEEILRKDELTYVPQRDVIIVTTTEHAEDMQVPKAYQVMRPMSADDLIEELTRLIAPESWSDVGGPGAISPFSFGVLVISQTDANHRKIAEHYKDLFRPLPVVKEGAGKPGRAAQGIEKLLEQPVTVEFLETPLKNAAAYLSDKYRIRITVDERGLNEVGLDQSTSLNIQLTQVPLRTVLDLMLEPLALTWHEDQGMIEITTFETLETKMKPVTYPMRALAGAGDLREWAEVITSTIAPHSWDEVGGPGSVTITQRGTLEILQTYHVQRQIAQLLEAIATVK